MSFAEIAEKSIGKITVGDIFVAIVTFVIGFIILKILLKIINKLIDKTKLEKTLTKFLKLVLRVAGYFVLAIIVLDAVGISSTSLVAVFSVFGLAASLAAQNSLSNFAGGVLLMIIKPFSVDDYVEVAGSSGIINEIGFIYTKLTTFDNKVIYIPNSDISARDIVNYTQQKLRRVDLTFSADYSAPISKVKDAIMEAVCAIPEVLKDEELFVNVSAYNDSSIEYVVRVWTDTENYWTVYNRLMEDVKHSFDRNGVEMTYDHLNVHVIENPKGEL